MRVWLELLSLVVTSRTPAQILGRPAAVPKAPHELVRASEDAVCAEGEQQETEQAALKRGDERE